MRRALALLVLLFALPAPAVVADGLAEVPGDCAPPSDTVIDTLIHWIGANSPYDVRALHAAPPSVSFCRTGQEITYEGQDLIVDELLRAAYDARANRIYLVLPWHEDDPRDRSALLHELVHAAQMGAADWPCVQAMEWDAYQLQAEWLRQQGIDPGFNWFDIYMRAQCPKDIHP
ncbi:DUF6647 family protein [Marimonas lutisalis]|uniref:DUF6647 family protein n=1 Tax=Marimonas lutisalis TaxID=2545756 RepID=UPI0010F9C818|nr:DUF6647 family protein [Marimonas lutisalis]